MTASSSCGWCFTSLCLSWGLIYCSRTTWKNSVSTGKSVVVPSCRTVGQGALDLCCFIHEIVLTQIFKAVAVCQPARCSDDPMLFGLGEVRLPSCQPMGWKGFPACGIRAARGGQGCSLQVWSPESLGLLIPPAGCWQSSAVPVPLEASWLAAQKHAVLVMLAGWLHQHAGTAPLPGYRAVARHSEMLLLIWKEVLWWVTGRILC